MAFTQADLDAIETALKSGELRVRLGDKEVQYRTLDDLIRARAIIASELSGTSRSGMLRIKMHTDKGIR